MPRDTFPAELPPEGDDLTPERALYAWETRPSKSQRKRDSHDLQSLGKALLEMPASRLQSLDLPESLTRAIDEYQRTRSFEGRRRHIQYIGKLMRQVDPEPIQRAVDDIKKGRAVDAMALHAAEDWRTRLITDDLALSQWMVQFPQTDSQQLRSLIRAARKEAQAPATPDQSPEARAVGAHPRHGRAFRELFQHIKDTLKANAEGDGDQEEAANE
jgi:ribosome-associated protein